MKISVTQKTNTASTSSKRLLRKWRIVTVIWCLTALFAMPVYAQNITVRGHIVNETSQPVPGASVVVKGTEIGTSTDAAGNYQINAPAKGTLVISSVGFGTREIDIKGQ